MSCREGCIVGGGDSSFRLPVAGFSYYLFAIHVIIPFLLRTGETLTITITVSSRITISIFFAAFSGSLLQRLWMSFGPYGTLLESQGTVTLRLTRRPRIRLFQRFELAWILEIPTYEQW